MSKTKIVETFTEQSVSDFGTELRNCARLEFRKSGIGQFCAKWLLRMIAQIVVFSGKTDAQRKKHFAFRSAKIAQKFCEWKPYFWSGTSTLVLKVTLSIISSDLQFPCKDCNAGLTLVPLNTLSDQALIRNQLWKQIIFNCYKSDLRNSTVQGKI